MTNERSPLFHAIQSRKMWATLIGIVMMIVTAIINKQAIDPDTLVNGIMILVSVYVSAVALEDGMTQRNATQTTVTTPGTSEVQVSQPVAPAKPFIGPDGLRG